MKRIAIPVFEGKLSPHFGRTPNFIFYNIKDETIVNEDTIKAPPHEPGIIPNWLVEQKITDLIVGGIGQKAMEILNQHDINVNVGVQVNDPKLIIEEYLNGTLETNMNLCDH